MKERKKIQRKERKKKERKNTKTKTKKERKRKKERKKENLRASTVITFIKRMSNKKLITIGQANFEFATEENQSAKLPSK